MKNYAPILVTTMYTKISKLNQSYIIKQIIHPINFGLSQESLQVHIIYLITVLHHINILMMKIVPILVYTGKNLIKFTIHLCFIKVIWKTKQIISTLQIKPQKIYSKHYNSNTVKAFFEFKKKGMSAFLIHIQYYNVLAGILR